MGVVPLSYVQVFVFLIFRDIKKNGPLALAVQNRAFWWSIWGFVQLLDFCGVYLGISGGGRGWYPQTTVCPSICLFNISRYLKN